MLQKRKHMNQVVKLGIYYDVYGFLYEVFETTIHKDSNLNMVIYRKFINKKIYKENFSEFTKSIIYMNKKVKRFSFILSQTAYKNINKLNILAIQQLEKLINNRKHELDIIKLLSTSKIQFPKIIKQLKFNKEDELYILNNINNDIVAVAVEEIFEDQPTRIFSTSHGAIYEYFNESTYYYECYTCDYCYMKESCDIDTVHNAIKNLKHRNKYNNEIEYKAKLKCLITLGTLVLKSLG